MSPENNGNFLSFFFLILMHLFKNIPIVLDRNSNTVFKHSDGGHFLFVPISG